LKPKSGSRAFFSAADYRRHVELFRGYADIANGYGSLNGHAAIRAEADFSRLAFSVFADYSGRVQNLSPRVISILFVEDVLHGPFATSLNNERFTLYMCVRLVRGAAPPYAATCRDTLDVSPASTLTHQVRLGRSRQSYLASRPLFPSLSGQFFRHEYRLTISRLFRDLHLSLPRAPASSVSMHSRADRDRNSSIERRSSYPFPSRRQSLVIFLLPSPVTHPSECPAIPDKLSTRCAFP